MNYGKIAVIGEDGEPKKITKLKQFLEYRGADVNLINLKASRKKK